MLEALLGLPKNFLEDLLALVRRGRRAVRPIYTRCFDSSGWTACVSPETAKYIGPVLIPSSRAVAATSSMRKGGGRQRGRMTLNRMDARTSASFSGLSMDL